MKFCFFHVGSATEEPQMLVNSIKKFNPTSEIICCTDRFSPVIQGVQRLEFDGNPKELMLFRVKSFANAQIMEPAIYLDTDMLCYQSIQLDVEESNKDIFLCERSFNAQTLFKGNFLGLNFKEYDKKPFGQVYPYLACATITKNSLIWNEILDLCEELSQKFKIWYGDQEAMKLFVKNTKYELGFIPENQWACLPEYSRYCDDIKFMHFKGARKKLMQIFYDNLMAEPNKI
jgi:hypothetical protein